MRFQPFGDVITPDTDQVFSPRESWLV